MKTLRLISLGLLVAAATPAIAQPARDEALRRYIGAGAETHAILLRCGRISQAQVTAHRAKLRREFSAEGVPPAEFDRIFDTAFDASSARMAAAPPTHFAQGCARLEAQLRTMAADIRNRPAAARR